MKPTDSKADLPKNDKIISTWETDGGSNFVHPAEEKKELEGKDLMKLNINFVKSKVIKFLDDHHLPKIFH